MGYVSTQHHEEFGYLLIYSVDSGLERQQRLRELTYCPQSPLIWQNDVWGRNTSNPLVDPGPQWTIAFSIIITFILISFQNNYVQF